MAQSLTELQAALADWEAALQQAAKGKSFTITTAAGGSRTVTKRDTIEIRQMISYYERRIRDISKPGGSSIFAAGNMRNLYRQ